ncbi:MAG: bifunctional hydroxymethylpyrimidine kinase/phosphomethylpyrimidine kinase [Gemmatimonadaceae bacterium]|nr:bifunctional hydroxymethylpyrimidine kinase/phosphomethylpyrimidine kinase [Gemmatimonadaceae bacterium]
MATPPIALTIAGSDSGGGAGVQADIKTFHHFHVFGTSAITAVTAQNTRGVQGWVAIPVSMIEAQIDSVAGDLRPAATKTGMLADSAIVTAVAASIRRHAFAPLVVDPVMVSASGDPLLERDAVAALRDVLIPLATLVTPNLDEAEILVGETVRDVEAMERAGRVLVARGATAALIKGGHLVGDAAIDVLVHGDRVRVFTHPRLETRHTHGTGCTLSSAITALLARGIELDAAVEQAIDWVHRAIATAPALGAGHGPLNHWAD